MFQSISTTLQRYKTIRTKAKEERAQSKEKTGMWSKIKAERTLIALAGLLILVRLMVAFGGSAPSTVYVPLQVGDHRLYLEYVQSKGELKRGLKYRPGLAQNSGMIFDLNAPQLVKVTMQGVNFPIQVATLDGFLKVQEVQTLRPGDEDLAFSQPSRYFLEIHPDVPIEPGWPLQEFTSTLNLPTRPLLERGQF